jgi:hypothetical protein
MVLNRKMPRFDHGNEAMHGKIFGEREGRAKGAGDFFFVEARNKNNQQAEKPRP